MIKKSLSPSSLSLLFSHFLEGLLGGPRFEGSSYIMFLRHFLWPFSEAETLAMSESRSEVLLESRLHVKLVVVILLLWSGISRSYFLYTVCTDSGVLKAHSS